MDLIQSTIFRHFISDSDMANETPSDSKNNRQTDIRSPHINTPPLSPLSGDWIPLSFPVPRDQSLSDQLSRYTWSKGVSCFFSEQIPFSSYSSLWFADLCKQVFESVTESQHQQSTTQSSDTFSPTFLEVGAGYGMLSKHFLDRLSTEKSLYEATTVVVSDASEAIVSDLQTQDSFSNHKNIFFHRLDLCDPDTFTISALNKPKTNYTMMSMIYVLDSLPSRHFVYKKGRLLEYFVHTFLDANCHILDTREVPFAIHHADEISHMLREGDLASLWHFAPQLERYTKEVFVEQEVSDLPHMDLIQRFLTTLDTHQTHYLNISPDGISALYHAIDHVEDGGVIVLAEFGRHTTTAENPDTLVTAFRTMRFYRICFPLFHFICDELGVTMITESDSDLFFIYKGPADSPIVSKIREYLQLYTSHNEQESANTSLQIASDMVQEVVSQLASFEGTHDLFEQALKRQLSPLPPLMRDDYFLNVSLAKCCFLRSVPTSASAPPTDDERAARHQLLQLAEAHAKKAISSYDAVDIDARLLLTQIYCTQRRYTDAQAIIDPLLAHVSGIETIYSQASIIYGLLGDKSRQLDYILLYFKHTRHHFIWSHCVTLTLFLILDKQVDDARSLLRWFKQASLYMESIPTQVRLAMDSFTL